MLDINRSMIIETHIQEVSANVANLEEGTAMVHVLENGKGVLARSTGTAGEKFGGVAHSKHLRPTIGRMVELLTVADGKVVLSRTPRGAAADRGVFNASGTALASSATVDANTKYNLTGKTITVHADLEDTVIKVQYEYDLTATEAALLYGSDMSVLDVAAAKNVGVVTTGTVFVDNYDPAVNWANDGAVSPNIKLGANGNFTIGGSGTDVDAVVVSVPTANDPFLGMLLHP